MKKLLVILLLITYGFSSMGITINLHYCCGKLKSIDWTPAKANACNTHHKMTSAPCCETKQISNRENADQEKYQMDAKSTQFPSIIAFLYTELFVFQSAVRPFSTVAFAPPPLHAVPLFILNCIYRI